MGDAENMQDSRHGEDEPITDVTEKYRNLLHEAMLINEEDKPGRDSVQHISALMSKANVLIKNVKKPDDAVIDAKVLNVSSSVLKRTAEAIDTNLFSFETEEYCKNILLYLKEKSSAFENDRIQWQKLAPIAKRCFLRTPSFTCMLGTFQVGEVATAQRKARKQRDRQEVERKKQPENVKRIDKEEHGVEETVEYILTVLTAAYIQNKKQPISFFELVINPDSFGATVENIFHVSFLLRDGYAEFSWDENKLPVIAPVSKDVIERRKKYQDQEKHQMIIGIDMKQWEELKEAFEIREAMLKPRSIVSTQESYTDTQT